jgi:predicted nucleic acid-binding protein
MTKAARAKPSKNDARKPAAKRARKPRPLTFGEARSRRQRLWIAATAIDRGAVLVSADPDFARMANVIDLVVEDWTRP